MVFLQNFAREIGARATRTYAFAHARAFDRDEVSVSIFVIFVQSLQK